MSLKKIYFLLFIAGLGAGVFLALNNARASNPQGEVSLGEQPASVYYDEYWKASEALVSQLNGGFKIFNKFSAGKTDTAAKIGKTGGSTYSVDTFPKMLVTKWTVHGHIHFQ